MKQEATREEEGVNSEVIEFSYVQQDDKGNPQDSSRDYEEDKV